MRQIPDAAWKRLKWPRSKTHTMIGLNWICLYRLGLDAYEGRFWASNLMMIGPSLRDCQKFEAKKVEKIMAEVY